MSDAIYECDQCGACCKHLIVEVDGLDTLREPRLFPAAIKEGSGWRPTTQRDLDGDEGRRLLLTCGTTCAFLSSDNRCTIYPTRPNVCVSMQAGDEGCREARRLAELEPLQPVGVA